MPKNIKFQQIYNKFLDQYGKDGKSRYYAHKAGNQRLVRQRRKVKVINMLGGECVRCGITDPRILTINHKNGGGRQHLTSLRGTRGSQQLYKDILRGNIDTYTFDIRCFNCQILYEYERGRLSEERISLPSWHRHKSYVKDCILCKARFGVAQKRYRMSLRQKMFDIYGNECIVCKTKDKRILTVNHINGNGSREYKKHGGSVALYRVIIKMPRPDIDIRCMNHNILYEYERDRYRWSYSNANA